MRNIIHSLWFYYFGIPRVFGIILPHCCRIIEYIFRSAILRVYARINIPKNFQQYFARVSRGVAYSFQTFRNKKRKNKKKCLVFEIYSRALGILPDRAENTIERRR